MDVLLLATVLLLVFLVFIFGESSSYEKGMVVCLATVVLAISYIDSSGRIESGNLQKIVPAQIKSVPLEETVLFKFETAGIWKVDRPNHRCLMDRGVWDRLPLDKKEQCLQAIYAEEKTWWKIYDQISGKLLGEVSSWGWKVHP